MAAAFQSFHFNVASASDVAVQDAGSRPLALRAGPSPAPAPSTFVNEEAAARYYLSNLLQRDSRATLRGLTAPGLPQLVPDLKLRDTQRSPLTRTSLVRFVQTKALVPIFGSRANVEIDERKELLGVDAELAEVDGVSPVAKVSPEQALESITKSAGRPPSSLQNVNPPKLVFFYDEDHERWHLAWHIRNAPVAPADYLKGLHSHGVGRSLAQQRPELDYLVDAHGGTVILYWSSVPTAIAPVALVRCQGVDEEEQRRVFFGSPGPSNDFMLSDPLRRIRTFDFAGQDIEDAVPPAQPISSPTTNFADRRGAISAHFNATRVHDFFKSVLMRDGIDDKGMELISYVNCTYSADQPPPEWHNAAWWKHRMWYGQSRDANGTLRSFARHLDIIAHELAHGVTEFTADLIYLKQSGALNESFSDIFGTIISNWDWSQPDTGGNVAAWNWEIGQGLGHGGLPLRDMSNPSRTSDPEHMSNYSETSQDNGGVHTNSNIHNKAAFNVLTAADAQGNAVFTPQEIAVLYYLTLTRLDKVASFAQTRATLLNVAGLYFSGDAAKLAAISAAYDAVGIT
jgi:Zn-dependent metalloprotease